MNISNNFLSKHWIIIVLLVVGLFLLFKFNNTRESFQYYTPKQNSCDDINNYAYLALNNKCNATYDTSNNCVDDIEVKINNQHFSDNSNIVDGEIQFDLDSCTLDKDHIGEYKNYGSKFMCSN